MDQLVEARHRHELQQYMKVLHACDLLILDEFGYQQLPQEHANVMFQLFAGRHEQHQVAEELLTHGGVYAGMWNRQREASEAEERIRKVANDPFVKRGLPAAE